MKCVSLFGGIGGFDLGFRERGFETILFAESDPAAAAVLRVRFPRAKIVGDVRCLETLPKGVDVVTAGFPCQDLSQAGRRAGFNGARSGLAKEIFRLLEARPVPWVVLENVPFMLHLQAGLAIARTTSRLEKLGYRWAYRVVDSMAFGLPQRRRRLFIVASLDGDPRRVLHTDNQPAPRERAEPFGRHPVGFYWTEGNRGIGWAVDAIPTLKGASGHGIPCPPAVVLPRGRVVVPTIRAAERLQGFPDDWSLAASDAQERPRWRLVGNAVNVTAASWLAGNLKKPPRAAPPDGLPLARHAWPSAAYGDASGRYGVDVSPFPLQRLARPITSVLGQDTKPLSVRAASGFLGRLLRSNLRQADDPKFVAALRRHIDRCTELADAAE